MKKLLWATVGLAAIGTVACGGGPGATSLTSTAPTLDILEQLHLVRRVDGASA